MQNCILHVGIPKTGTTSTQDYLWHELKDRRFRYVDFGVANGTRALFTIALEQPELFPLNRRRGIGQKRARRMQTKYISHLRRALKRAQERGQTPILSGEGCWSMERNELFRLKKLIEEIGFIIKPIAYLRPILSWLGSNFQ